jgi:lysophospholipase L1-like esterase
MINFGDSITVGIGASPTLKSWVNLFAPLNQAVSGSQAAEVANAVQTAPVNNLYTFMIGTNDVRVYKNDATKKQYFKKFLMSALAFVAFPVKLTARSMIATGTWANTQVNTFGRVTTQNGASLKGSFTGNKVFLSYIIQHDVNATGVGNVYIDGVLVGTVSSNGYTVPMNTQNGLSYASACDVFNTTDGTHEIEIVNQSPNGKILYINWIATEQTSPAIYVSNIIKLSSSVYSQLGISQATTESYNAIIDDVLQNFNAVFVDNFNSIDPTLHLPDGVHPNNAGHAIIFNNFKNSM